MTGRSWFRVLAVVYVVTTLASWAVLPDRVPVHFGVGGEPDRVVGRGRAVAELLASGVLLVAVLSATIAAVPRLPASMINVPRKDYWGRPENRSRLQRLVTEDLRVVGSLTIVLLLGILLMIVSVADDPRPALGPGFWWLLGGYLLALAGYLVVALRRYRQVPP